MIYIKAKRVFEKILKAIGGLYIIGVIVGLNEIISAIVAPVMVKLSGTTFFQMTMKPWADVIIGPIRFLIGFIPWLLGPLVLSVLATWGLSKMKFVSEKELKVFMYALAFILLLVL